jgi:hypothetical protein
LKPKLPNKLLQQACLVDGRTNPTVSDNETPVAGWAPTPFDGLSLARHVDMCRRMN